MALRALQGPAGGSAPVGGSGTSSPSTIPRWTGPTTLGDSLITQSGSFTGVNCGAGLPTQPLHVVGNILATLGSVSGQSIQLAPGNSYGTLSSGSGLILSAAAGTLIDGTFHQFRSAGGASTRMVIDTSGNVGIGTTSPTGRLHVVGGTAAASTNGAPVTIVAQSGGTGNTNGGSIVLTPGTQAGTGTVGLVDLSGPTGTGLKLPATPGNADTQTLDAYRENTFTTTTSSATNCSSITLSNLRYTQIGRLVTIEGTASFTVTAATTATSFYFTLPSGCNRGSTANAGAGLAVDNASGYSGALWNLAGTNNDVFLFFDASNPFGAGTSRTVPFSYSYYTAT